MKDIGSREFQISYQKLREPVRVVAMSGAASRVIGHFYPGDLPPDQGEQKGLFDEEIEEPEVPSGGPD